MQPPDFYRKYYRNRIRGHLVCPYDKTGPISLLQMVYHMAIKTDFAHRTWRKQHGLPEYVGNALYGKYKNKLEAEVIGDLNTFIKSRKETYYVRLEIEKFCG